MTAPLLVEETVEIPADVGTLDEFRRWSSSDSFPQTGRIDYINGRIEVDMSPEDFWFHGVPKNEINTTLHSLAKQRNLGQVVVDRTRIVNESAGLSAEPDVVVIAWQSFTSESSKVRQVRLG